MSDFDDLDNPGIIGVGSDRLVNDLHAHGNGYVLEITSDDSNDNVVADAGPTGMDTAHATIDFGTAECINEELGTNISDEHCITLSGDNGHQLTIAAVGDKFATFDTVHSEAQEYDRKDDLVDAVDNWVRTAGIQENTDDDFQD